MKGTKKMILFLFLGLICVLAGCIKPLPTEKQKPIYEEISVGNIVKVKEKPESGFHWPYYLYIPQMSIKENKLNYLLVIPNNSFKCDDSIKFHDDSARKRIENHKMLADYLGTPLLMPTFPRPMRHWKIYTQSLDRNTILTGIKTLKRLDLQLIGMIENTIKSLLPLGIHLDKKVLMWGFSASGMFVSRFAIIHPERIQAAAIGSPGGWPIVPLAEWHSTGKGWWNNTILRYPIGVGDFKKLFGKEFDLESFKSIPLYFFIGGNDTNDAVSYWDAHDLTREKIIIFENFGDKPIARWPIAEKIYASAGCTSQFVVFPGVGHRYNSQMWSAFARFLKNHM